MCRFIMNRENDYPPEHSRRGFSGDSLKTESGDSDDMDFNDVFGVPSRRFSMQEVRVRYSFGESDEDKGSPPWIALTEKPVFGEESTTRRRRQGGEFFDDIFRVDECHSSTMRTDNLIGSSPSGTSLPTQLSLPAKPTKFMEFPTFGSPNHSPHKKDTSTNGSNSPHTSSASLSRFSNQSIHGHEEIKNEVLPIYQQSPLPRQGSKKDTKSVDNNNSSQFHFSIYKWAGKGVPMLIPLVGRNNLRTKDINTSEPSKNVDPESLEIENEQVKSVDEVGIVKKIEEECLGFEVKPLCAWIANEVEERGNVTEKKENKSTSPKRAQFEAGKHVKKNEVSLQGEALNPQPPRGKSRVKGMVKDFVHNFDQEADPSPKANSQTKSSRKTVIMDQKHNEVILNAENYDLSQPSSRVDENLNKDEEQKCNSTETSIHRDDHFPTIQKSACSSETLNMDSKFPVENSDDPFEDNFQVQELSDDLENATQNDEGSDDTKDLDAKIRQWSFGKKGNIRSLLSTLQFVLWPGSGWKPVPLMELIEANSVKRAYQKALLRLHPDKLQQKGAHSHHKYIAQNIFDILQAAWDHFNTLASV